MNTRTTTETRLNRLHFLLSQSQGATNANDNFTINPIKKLFQIRGLILQIDFTTCQLPIKQEFQQIVDYQLQQFVQFNTGFYWFVTVNNFNKHLRRLKYISNENKSTRYAVGPEFKPERYNDNNIPNNDDKNNRPNDNNNNNNTPTSTTTSNTPTTTIPSTLTTSIPTTRTESTITIFTFPDIPSYSTIDDTSTTTTPTKTTTTTTILSKTTTNTNTITTNSSNIDLSKTTIQPIPPKPISENYISCPICKEELKESEIENHLKENPLSKDTICDKLKIKKHSTSFTRIKEIINKITDVRIKEIIEKI
ncbi:hypothetical protein F8M41_004386 [Gigaspora margarita]|uniref:Uncharacterized protein n=1 Tax=Gigaspora margarita TaxID=4874 RepID=A0A8H4B4K1_GIGMA|nr:hypothetical protein F8M41_004386 [Gigaspora margarita]